MKRTYINHRQTYFQLTKATNPKKFWKAFDQIGISNDKASNRQLSKAAEDGWSYVDASLVFNKEDIEGMAKTFYYIMYLNQWIQSLELTMIPIAAPMLKHEIDL